jgi:putative ABC transport system permease protein
MKDFLGTLFRRRRFDDLAAEIDDHIEQRTEELVARGMDRDDALVEARRAFGNRTRIEESGRDVWRLPALDAIAADIRFALRTLRRHPAFAWNVVAISALGIALCVTTFSVVSGILLAPLPFSSPHRVFDFVIRSTEGDISAALTPETYRRVAADSTLIASIASASPGGKVLDAGGEPERLRSAFVTASFFKVYGVAPILGRSFTQAEQDSEAPVTLLSHDSWVSRFRRDSSIIGRSLNLDGKSYTVIGVTPAGFRAHFLTPVELWIPVDARNDGRSSVNGQVRLADGVTSERATAWLATVVRERMESRTTRDSVVATPMLVPIAERIRGDVERPLKVLLASVLLVLLLVSANVATVFLARAAARVHEIEIRRAVGASAGRQAQQMIVESLTLTGIGAVAGTIVSYSATAAVRGLGVLVLPRMDAVAVDWRVLTFAIGALLAMALSGGLAPIVFARRGRRIDGSGARVTRARASAALVVAQIALSVVLLSGGGLLVKSFLRIAPSSPGFATENRAVLAVSLRGRAEFPANDTALALRFMDEVRGRMSRANGVRAVAATSFVPFYGSAANSEVLIPGEPEPQRSFTAYQNIVTPNYFEVMEIPLVRGRAFAESDRTGTLDVAVVNEEAARRWWADKDPIGRQVVLTREGHRPLTVVGVSTNGRLFGSDTRSRPELFYPAAQHFPTFISFIAHTQGDPTAVMRDLKRAIWGVAPRLPITAATSINAVAMGSVRRSRFFAWAMGTFAACAVALSALAVYGLFSFAVTQRKREFGIRLAIGATPGAVGRSVMWRAALIGGSGVAVGVVTARAFSRFLESLLHEVKATDAGVFAMVGTIALGAAVLAACIPAWRALRVDPAMTLRE